MTADRVRLTGKYFRLHDAKWYVRGFSYGPFAPNDRGEPFPSREQLRADFAHIRDLGGNCIRVYFPPPEWVLNEALAHELRVFVDVPWEKHRCFFEDWAAQQRALTDIRTAARSIGGHPGVFAISVGNEIPADVVRFYGQRRIERFIGELIDQSKQQAPECPVTYVNFPTTEFLDCGECDFLCFNVYLHDERRLGAYLNRLQHVAGNKPLVLGEYGVDTLREGEAEQSRCLAGHLQCVSRHGLAGSFVFAYTDDWFTGGESIDDWAFGVTDRQRREKSSAAAVRDAWRNMPGGNWTDLPRASVVVCSRNGGETLEACLESLMKLDYPDYEVILVDDGSTDRTPQIAQEFPQIVYHRQPHRGLSAARNVGAWLATGEIVAYTDDDCVADEHWLNYLVGAMRDQQVQAIGGPNVTPADDGWIARCVAASPGNPSHVMLDDRRAEHVPGCNMAFVRQTLLGLGGFDPQFRVAGDDVDVCWRFLDAGLPIGYAAGAMVWHHRRSTIVGYAKQQKGYGRSEAMIHFKHPQRCAAFGRSHWQGVIYGDGAVGLPRLPPRIYHGSFGSGPFQTIYRRDAYGLWSVAMSLEWHLLAAYLLLLAVLYLPLAAVAAAMEAAALSMAVGCGWRSRLPAGAPWWCRPLVCWLYFMQPIWRGWTRLTYLLWNKRLRHMGPPDNVQSRTGAVWDLYWDNRRGVGRYELLPRIVERAKSTGWAGDFDNAWADWDVKLVGDRWHNVTIRTATEELGWPRRFTRTRCAVQTTQFTRVLALLLAVWTAIALVVFKPWALLAGATFGVWMLVCIAVSRRRCLRATTSLVSRAAALAGLDEEAVDTDSASTAAVEPEWKRLDSQLELPPAPALTSLGAGLVTSPRSSTGGLSTSPAIQQKTLRSIPCAGSGDPRTAEHPTST